WQTRRPPRAPTNTPDHPSEPAAHFLPHARADAFAWHANLTHEPRHAVAAGPGRPGAANCGAGPGPARHHCPAWPGRQPDLLSQHADASAAVDADLPAGHDADDDGFYPHHHRAGPAAQ